MTTKIINDLGFVLLGILMAFGIYSEQFQNQWVVLFFSNALISFFFIHYKPETNLLKKWMNNGLVKEKTPVLNQKNNLSNSVDLPPIPSLQSNKLETIKQKYNINPNVDYSKDDHPEDTINNVIPLMRVKTNNGSQEMTQVDVDSFIQESKKVVRLDDYRRKKTGSGGFNPPTQGA